MQDASLTWEGLKKDAFWAFTLTSSDGVVLLRLSSNKREAADAWVQVRASAALQHAHQHLSTSPWQALLLCNLCKWTWCLPVRL